MTAHPADAARTQPGSGSIGNFRRQKRVRGFTLIEALLVVSIVALLATLTFPLFGFLRAKAAGAVCISNLRLLHTSFVAYLQDHNEVWPQYPTPEGFENEVEESRFWHDKMEEYGAGKKHWICPSDTESVKQHKQMRRDDFVGSYNITPFDNNPRSAYRWKQPWIIERGSFHSPHEGPNMVMPDGTITQGYLFPSGEQ